VEANRAFQLSPTIQINLPKVSLTFHQVKIVDGVLPSNKSGRTMDKLALRAKHTGKAAEK